MTTQRQIIANQQNAKQSTGPKTLQGKTVTAQNALKHGFFSKEILLDGESKKDFESLKMEFYDQFNPQSFLERLFLERALAATWRLSRITQMESVLMNHAAKKSFEGKGFTEVLSGYLGDELTLLSRYEISLERVLFRSLVELRSLQENKESCGQVEIGFVPQNYIEEVIR